MEDVEVKTNNDTELDSLIRLLPDDNESMQSAVNARLFELGEDIVPSLWDARLSASDVVRARIDDILVRLSSEAGEELALQEWRELLQFEGDVDLEEGVAALARLQTLDLNWSTSSLLDDMADELSIRLAGISDPNEIVENFTQYVFQEQGFQGGEDSSYFDADEHFMDRVVQHRSGVPIALSTVCLLLARRTSIPLFGVGLPDHFIVKYQEGDTEIYFAPFHDGAVISREECEEFVTRQKVRFSQDMLTAVDTRYILERMLNNLRYVYTHHNDRAKLNTVLKYTKILKEKT